METTDFLTKNHTTNLADLAHIYALYQNLIMHMPNLVYWLDKEGAPKGCNNNFLQLLGLKTHNEFIGLSYEQMAMLMHWTEDTAKNFKRDDVSVIFSGAAECDIEEPPVYSKNNKNDGFVYYRATKIPLFDFEKNVIGMMAILVDDTEHKKIMAQQNVEVSKETDTKSSTTAKEKNISILLVEDNLVAQKVARVLLTSLHCHVDIAASGDEAIALFQPGKYDLVLMDIELQDTSGYMVSKHFRDREKNTKYRSPIIALTIHKAQIIKDACKEFDMDDVFTKPLTSNLAEQILQQYVYTHSG